MNEIRPDKESANLEYHLAQDRMAQLTNYYRWIHRLVSPWISGRVLEIGCGAGAFLQLYQRQAAEVVAVDINPQLIGQVSSASFSCPVNAMVRDLREPWVFPGVTTGFSTIIALDVLEHFEDDQSIIASMAGALAPGGVAVLKVPAQKALYSSVDQASGHYRRYDLSDIKRLAERAGLTVAAHRRMNVVGAFVYRFKRGSKTNFSRSLPRWFLWFGNAMVPVLRLIDRIVPLPGQSLIVVLRK